MIKRQVMNLLRWLGGMLIIASTVAAESNSIKSVEIKPADGGKQEIIVSMQKSFALPASFVVNTPPRIAFDFVDSQNETGKSVFPVSGDALRSINIAEANGRTRLVLNLNKNLSYTTSIDGAKFKIVLVTNPEVVQTSPTTTQFSIAQNSKRESIRSVDFRRGKAGEGRIEVELSNPNIGIDLRQQGKSLVLEFAKSSLPRQYERRMDVTDFGTLVQTIDTFSQGETVKMVVEPKGNWEYSAYQTENRFIVEVKASDEAAKRLEQLDKPSYKGDKLSLNFQNVEVRTVLQVIAEFTGKNIITSDTVNGALTLRLKDVPWDQALDLILQSKGLDKRENGNVLWVAPREEIAAREKLTLEAKKQIQEIEPLKTETFQLNYLKAEDFSATLQNEKNGFLSKRGSAFAETRTNMLIVSDVPSKLEEIRSLINRADVAARQVLIEARIVIARDDFSRTLGARLAVRGDRTVGDKTRIGIGGTMDDGLNVLSKGVSATSSIVNVNLPSGGINATVPAQLGVTLFNSSVGALVGLELQALEAEGNGRTISSPRVITGDQQKATISQGTRFYINRATTDGVVSEEKEAVLKLEVTPRITPDRRIFMELRISKDARQPDNTIDTRYVVTNVLVGNGDTAVLGGVYEQAESFTETKVPLLGDIPVLGNFFKKRDKVNNKTELLIFITPRIVEDSLTLR